MKIRLGLIGADDSVAQIQTVARDYPEIELRPLVYWREPEVIDILSQHISDMDMWLFSGQVPYSIAKKWGRLNVPIFYVPHTGSSLYGLLLYLVHEQGLRLSEMSFDTFHSTEMKRLLEDIGIYTDIHLYHYPDEIEAGELAQYHADLWRNGVTKVAVTCLRSAQIELQRLGVPAYHVLPARTAILSTFESILKTHQLLHYRSSQVAVLLLDTGELQDEAGYSRAGTESHLKRWARRLAGTLQETSSGEFAIWTTRRHVEDITNGFHTVPALPGVDLPPYHSLCSGVGLGQTVAQAQEHARLALQYARKYGTGNWCCVLDDKHVIGPLGKQNQLTYSYTDEQLRGASQKVSLSTTTLSKLQAILRNIGKNEITSRELAEHMGILPRSARRILLELEQAGFANVVGEEAPHMHGRPRKIYYIHFGNQ